jgi:hypothetical protein
MDDETPALAPPRMRFAIATIGPSRTYYTMPWAMWADRDGLLWLHPDYPAIAEPFGTICMRIELQDGGYHVWPGRYRSWKRQDRPTYAGAPSQPFIPVTAIERTGENG